MKKNEATKVELATTIVSDNNSLIYQSSSKGTKEYKAYRLKKEYTVNLPTAQIKISNGYLTQKHKDLVEFLMSKLVTMDIFNRVYFSLYEIKKELFPGENNTRLWRMIKDIHATSIEVITPVRRYLYNIFSSAEWDTRCDKFYVDISREYLNVLLESRALGYGKYVKYIAHLPHNISKHFVRYLLQFQNHQIHIDNYLEKFFEDTTRNAKYIYKKQIIEDADSGEFEQFGITHDGGLFKINRPSDIKYLAALIVEGN